MQELTFENHLKFGYNGVPFVMRQNNDDEFFVTPGIINRKMSFRDALLDATEKVSWKAEKLGLPIILYLSGGIDSELIARALKEVGCNFKCKTVQLFYDLNVGDTQAAADLLQELDVYGEFIKIDIENLPFDLEDYAQLTGGPTSETYPTLYLTTLEEGFHIIGAGDPCVMIDFEDDYYPFSYYKLPELSLPDNDSYRWVYAIREASHSWMNFFMNKKRQGAGCFFEYTPELIHAFLTDPEIVKITTGKEVADDSTAKIKMYQNAFPEIKQRRKLTGYETMANLVFARNRQLLYNRPMCMQVYYKDYHDAIWELEC